MKSGPGVVALVATVAVLLGGGVAHAEPPIKVPGGGVYTITIAETPCGSFTVDVVDSTKARVFTRPDGTMLLHAAGRLGGKLTSDESGRSLWLDFSGPVWLKAESTVLTGPSLLFSSTRLELVMGRTIVPNDPSIEWQITGRTTPLCPLLNP